jgi:diguanylate cyclase (GGDEF)-like protein
MDDGINGLAHEVDCLLAVRQSTGVPPLAAARLAALHSAKAHRVLRIFPIAAARRSQGREGGFAVAQERDGIDSLPTPIEGDEPLLRAIRCREPVQVPCGVLACRVLLPLAAGDEVRHVVEISDAVPDAPGARLAQALLPLLKSYYDLLADAETDPLTRLANRRLFYTQLGAGLANVAGARRRRYLALADIDHFKSVNDRFGHLYGDEILIHYARLLRDTFRAGDLVYRFGGEEFLIVYAVERESERQRPLERFRKAVERYEFPRVGRVTTSLGFAALGDALVPATTYVDRADRAVYAAKAAGRNRIREYEALLAEGALTVVQPEAGGEATLF